MLSSNFERTNLGKSLTECTSLSTPSFVALLSSLTWDRGAVPGVLGRQVRLEVPEGVRNAHALAAHALACRWHLRQVAGDASDDVLCPHFGFAVVSVVSVVRESATSAASIRIDFFHYCLQRIE